MAFCLSLSADSHWSLASLSSASNSRIFVPDPSPARQDFGSAGEIGGGIGGTGCRARPGGGWARVGIVRSRCDAGRSRAGADLDLSLSASIRDTRGAGVCRGTRAIVTVDEEIQFGFQAIERRGIGGARQFQVVVRYSTQAIDLLDLIFQAAQAFFGCFRRGLHGSRRRGGSGRGGLLCLIGAGERDRSAGRGSRALGACGRPGDCASCRESGRQDGQADPFQLCEFHRRQNSLGQSQGRRGNRAGLDGLGRADCEGCFDRGGDQVCRHGLGEEMCWQLEAWAEQGGGRGVTLAGQTTLEQVASAGHPTSDGPDGATQLLRGLVVGLPSQVTQHQRSTILRRQAAQLLIEHRSHSQNFICIRGTGGIQVADGVLATATAKQVRPSPRGDAKGDSIEPVREQASVTNFRSLANQNQKGRLKRVFDVARIAEIPTAKAQDHGPMQLDQRLEGGLIAPRTKAFQKLAVAEPGKGAVPEKPVELLQHDSATDSGHASINPRSDARSPKLLHRMPKPIREKSGSLKKILWNDDSIPWRNGNRLNNEGPTANRLALFSTDLFPSRKGVVERFEGNSGLAFLFGLSGGLLLALVAYVCAGAAEQFVTFSLLTTACGVFGQASLIAASLLLVYSAREAAATFDISEEGMKRSAWGRTTAISWRDLVGMKEFNATGAKGKVGASERCVLYGRGWERLAIPFRFVVDGPRLRAGIEPHLVSLRAKELDNLARNGRRFRTGRLLGFVLLTFMVPLFLLSGLAAFDPASIRQEHQALGMTLLGIVGMVGAPILAVIGAEVYSRELVVTPDGIARPKPVTQPLDSVRAIESMKVKVTDAEEPGTERVTVRGDQGQKIAIDSGMPGYRALLELLRSRTGGKRMRTPAEDLEFA